MCRRAIELACGLLHGQPARQKALRQRLEGELNELLSGAGSSSRNDR
jgi:hypothetical protein